MFCTRPTLSCIFIFLAPWNNTLKVEILQLEDTLSLFRSNQSFLFLLTAVCLEEKQEIPIFWYFAWPDRASNPLLETGCLTLTTSMQFRQQNEGKQNKRYKRKIKPTTKLGMRQKITSSLFLIRCPSYYVVVMSGKIVLVGDRPI